MKILFNDNWKFALSDALPTEMENVEIPHDWLIYDTNNLYKTSTGWYKKEFEISENDMDKIHTIVFDGVYMDTTVYINEKEAGVWKYGYTSFDINITPFMQKGTNTVTVRINHVSPNTRWYSGAGIFRNVWLKMQNKTHLIHNGIYTSAKKIQNSSDFMLEIDTEYTGEIDLIRYTLGEAVFETTNRSDGFLINAPKLWSTETPNLYSLKTELIKNGTVLDTEIFDVGFRYTEFSPTEGFKLNGETLKLHGVCMHHDHGALGSCFNVNAMKRQIEILKGMGVNSIRTSHNPPAPEMLDLCDQMGILVVDEAFDMWELSKTQYDYARFFPEWYKQDVASWIRRDRNHPSVIMWSMGNEIYDTHKDERGLEITKLLRNEVLLHDPKQNAGCTIGSNYMGGEGAQKCADEIKLAGYNYAEYLYDEHHAKYLDWFIYGSETASTVRSRGVYHFPLETPILVHEDLQCSDLGNSVVGWGGSSERTWTDDRDHDFCGGQYIWTGFDYIGEPTPYSTKNSYFGIVDTAGIPKASYYMYKAVWDKDTEPFIELFPYWDWNIGQTIDVIAYSNISEAELFLNGKSLGRKTIDLLKDKTLHFHWSVAYEPGELKVVAYKNGIEITSDTKKSFSEPERIVLEYNSTPIKANGTDLKYITVSVADKNGVPVENARNRIFVNIDDDTSAYLAGIDSGDSTDYDSYKGNSKRLFSGKLVVILKSTIDAGKVKINFSSKGLKSEAAEFEVLPCETPVGISVVKNKPTENPSTDLISTRKIELSLTGTNILTPDNKEVKIKAKILPENSDFKEIGWSVVLNSGILADSAKITGNNEEGNLEIIGDGCFKVRAVCSNGNSNPEVVSELTLSANGFGEAKRNPYKFNSASLYNISLAPLNIIERGAISGIRERTIIGFSNIDFGNSGSDRLILHVGNINGSPIDIEVWSGHPDEGGTKLITAEFEHNHLWDRFAPQSFMLPNKLVGIENICFVVDKHCIFGGFEFMNNRVYEDINITESDSVYGDEYKALPDRVESIGNNVLIAFNDLYFGETGAEKIIIMGRTKNDKNTINLRFKDENGNQINEIIEFKNSADYEEQVFNLKGIKGKQDLMFVFLPGSSFDFMSFRFDKN